MKKHEKELAKLLGDYWLEPNKAFAKGLKAQLLHPRKVAQKRSNRWLLAGTLLAMVAVITAVSLLQPGNKQLSHQPLLKEIYAKAFADSLPNQGKTTLWEIHSQMETGALSKQCPQYGDNGYGTEPSVFFKKDNVTAYAATYGPDKSVAQGYSEDADIPAFDPNAIDGLKDGQIQGVFHGTKFVDKNGKDISGDSSIESYNQSSDYTLYVKFDPMPEKGTPTSCQPTYAAVSVNKESGLFSSITFYRSSIDEEHTLYRFSRTIQMSNVSFDQALPVLESQGFDLKKATATMDQIGTAQITNKAAGYQFYYAKKTLGAAKLAEVTKDGKVTGYRYTFSNTPGLEMTIRTADAADSPATAEEFLRLAQQKGWTIVRDDNQPDVILKDYGKRGMRTIEATSDDTRYLFTQTASTDLPTVFTKAPIGAGIHEVTDPYGGTYTANDVLQLGPSILFFKPGNEPPVPLG